jgi:hypothetical protein
MGEELILLAHGQEDKLGLLQTVSKVAKGERTVRNECSPLACIPLLFKRDKQSLFAGFPIWFPR